ncbi:pre-mRNA splicing factor [Pseudozyma hubeiensis SY62]|uniref:Pre-mRNA splicing factor n=1 Tax=Pseudozyma hubeiensis (strain SY62) TaxID=1305764 RepID=R9P8H9_PSEHS|nr:pre-mRNA splicing factor [Pseudozyma hubeiensis SY62]GAC97654.1 pre-mRNA splicing factor [Pseudozyma hubeiensis SY62]
MPFGRGGCSRLGQDVSDLDVKMAILIGSQRSRQEQRTRRGGGLDGKPQAKTARMHALVQSGEPNFGQELRPKQGPETGVEFRRASSVDVTYSCKQASTASVALDH